MIMKTLGIFSLAAVLLAFTSCVNAQAKTETFKVSGNCGMCKTKIEKAAKVAGAKTASWDMDSKILTITYSGSSTNTAKIQEKIASVGYDNEGATATNESYNKLHGCCQYERTDATTNEAKADCCKKAGEKMECSKMGGKMDCCKKDGEKMDCCKDGKCTKEGHDGKDCCKKGEVKE